MTSGTSKNPLESLAGNAVEASSAAARDATRSAKSVGAAIVEGAAHQMDTISLVAHDAAGSVPAYGSRVAQTGEQLMSRGRQRIDLRVRKQPVEALLLAGAIGYLVGWATRLG